MEEKTKERNIIIKISQLYIIKSSNIFMAKLPVKTSLYFARLAKYINEELRLFEEQRKKMCEEFGKLDEKKQKYTFASEEKEKACKDKIKELLNIEVVIPLQPIGIKEIGEEAISPQDLFSLDGIIKELNELKQKEETKTDKK